MCFRAQKEVCDSTESLMKFMMSLILSSKATQEESSDRIAPSEWFQLHGNDAN